MISNNLPFTILIVPVVGIRIDESRKSSSTTAIGNNCIIRLHSSLMCGVPIKRLNVVEVISRQLVIGDVILIAAALRHVAATMFA